MSALPEIETMTALAYAGMDHRRYLKTTDPIERMVEVEIGKRVLKMREEHDEALVKAIGANTGNRVGSIVGRALSETTRSLARAMARR